MPDIAGVESLALAEVCRDHFPLDEQIDVSTIALAITLINWLQNPAEI
jgi:hypothetical protein